MQTSLLEYRDFKKNQCKLILDTLRSGFTPTIELRNIASQYNARILELRRGLYNGIEYNIVSVKRGDNYGFEYI